MEWEWERDREEEKPSLTINPDPVKPSCVWWNQIELETDSGARGSPLKWTRHCPHPSWPCLLSVESGFHYNSLYWRGDDPGFSPSGLVQLGPWNSESGAWNAPGRRRERLLQAQRSSGALILLITQAGTALRKAWCVWWAGCQALRSR